MSQTVLLIIKGNIENYFLQVLTDSASIFENIN